MSDYPYRIPVILAGPGKMATRGFILDLYAGSALCENLGDNYDDRIEKIKFSKIHFEPRTYGIEPYEVPGRAIDKVGSSEDPTRIIDGILHRPQVGDVFHEAHRWYVQIFHIEEDEIVYLTTHPNVFQACRLDAFRRLFQTGWREDECNVHYAGNFPQVHPILRIAYENAFRLDNVPRVVVERVQQWTKKALERAEVGSVFVNDWGDAYQILSSGEQIGTIDLRDRRWLVHATKQDFLNWAAEWSGMQLFMVSDELPHPWFKEVWKKNYIESDMPDFLRNDQ